MPWNLIGNPRAIRALETAVDSGAVQHAYLFVGPEGVGRATAACRLAQALNCTGRQPPCLECKQCVRIAAGVHADVQTVTIEDTEDAPSRKAISVKQLREVEQQIALNPFEGRTRVVIIDPADALLGPAQNTFLKTLEEPPPNVVIVLVVIDPERLLETIVSRCARIDFGLVPTTEIETALTARGTAATDARVLARLSGGRPGWAVSAAKDASVLRRRQEIIETARSLPHLTMSDRMNLAERLSASFKEDREPVLHTIAEWQTWWRDVFLVQSGAPDGMLNVDLAEELRGDAAQYERVGVLRFLNALLDASEWLRANAQSRIVFDSLMLYAPTPKRRAFTGP